MKTNRRRYILPVFTVACLFCAASVFFPHRAYPARYVSGEVTSAMLLQERLNLTISDKAVVSLGTKDGVTKGDILLIGTENDTSLTNPIGECAVIEVQSASSICEIIKAHLEIGEGSRVFAKKLIRADDVFYPLSYSLLSRVLDPYEPYQKISVYVDEIFDSGNNVTQLSRKIRKDVVGLLSQKDRVMLKPGLAVKDFQFYPGAFREDRAMLKQIMDKSGVDVFVTGSYAVDNGKLKVTLYDFDKTFGLTSISFQPNQTPGAEAAELVVPFKPIETKEYIYASIALSGLQYVPAREERAEIIRYEANGDAFKTNLLKKLDFDIVSPVDIQMQLDDEPIKLRTALDESTSTAVIPLAKGSHKVVVSYRRGYFANTRDAQLFASERPIQKEVMVEVGKEGDLYFNIALNPHFGKETVDFNLYRVHEKKQVLLKTIDTFHSGRSIEVFKD
jgi:hypothetical protein